MPSDFFKVEAVRDSGYLFVDREAPGLGVISVATMQLLFVPVVLMEQTVVGRVRVSFLQVNVC